MLQEVGGGGGGATPSASSFFTRRCVDGFLRERWGGLGAGVEAERRKRIQRLEEDFLDILHLREYLPLNEEKSIEYIQRALEKLLHKEEVGSVRVLVLTSGFLHANAREREENVGT